MPGWHEATKTLQDEGQIRMVGIVEEQHGDRARLFMQWKSMEWPVMVDALNLLDVPYVPITICIDEYGVIRKIAPPLSSAETVLKDFLATAYPEPSRADHRPVVDPDLRALEPKPSDTSATVWRQYADAVSMWGGARNLGRAIDAYERSATLDSDNDRTQFRLGVTYRARFDSEARKPGDFQKAAEHWQAALDLSPNNYIYRRRIQQYGPRLDKPYPFYDWIHQARADIAARGEEPVLLTVEPAGAEYAKPDPDFEPAKQDLRPPDPEAKIARDPGLIEIETAVVPSAVREGRAVRVHIVLRPNLRRKAHWNNEVDDLVLWIDPPQGWLVNGRRHTVSGPRDVAVSQEVRQLEFELRAPMGATGTVTIPAYALYYVCEDATGACLYRRQDVELSIAVQRAGDSE